MSVIALITNEPAIGIIANQIQLTQSMPNHRPPKEKTQPDFWDERPDQVEDRRLVVGV
jgi:hypothetical protein